MSKVDDFLAILVPRRCLLCNAPGGPGPVCGPCHADLPWLGAGCAPGGRLHPPAGPAEPRAACGPAPLSRVLAAFSYEYPVDRLITGAKFHGRPAFARGLGELLAGALGPHVAGGGRPDWVVPVPLHGERLAERGYNQAEEIAAPLCDALGLELAPRRCERVRNTAEQSGLSRAARRRNLRGAFRIVAACAGARVAVVDDVVTTGSTVAALARALRAAGAGHVEAWSVARTL